MKRKLLALLTTLCLCTSLLPTAALAAETEEVKIPEVPATSCTCATACTEGHRNTSCAYCSQEGVPAKNCVVGAKGNIYPIETHKSLDDTGENTSALDTLKAAINLSSGALKGKVLQLQEDITTSIGNMVSIPDGTSVILDLNGYNITIGESCSPICVNGTLTLRDSVGGGSINGNHTGTVLVQKTTSKFIMESGIITCPYDFYVFSPVGVSVFGEFEMKGGTIQNCSGHLGGSVSVAAGGSFTMSGSAQIIGATSGSSDVYLYAAANDSPASIMYANGGSIQGAIKNEGIITQTSNTTGTDFSKATFTDDSTGSIFFASETSLLSQMKLSQGTEKQITLGNDITLTKPFTMPDDANIILDLNGCAITGQSITVNNFLTIQDSRPDKTTHKLADGTTVTGGLITSDLINDGNLTLKSGTLTNLYIEKGSDFYAEGGTVLQTVQNSGTISRSVDENGETYADSGFTTFSGTVTNSYNGSTGTIDLNACMRVTFSDGNDSSSDGASTAPQYVLKGQKASDPNTSKNGMTAAWYQDKTRWDFSTPITEDLTLTAKWCYPIVIESSGHGTVTPTDSLMAPGETVSLRVEPEEGYELASLVLTYDPPVIAYDLGEEGEQSGTIVVTDNQFLMPNGPVSGKASFEKCEYTVTYDLGFGENSTYTTSTALHGDPLTAPAKPSRSGYAFFGWYNGDTKWNFVGDITADVVTGDMTLVAKWYPLSSSGGGGSSSIIGNNTGSNTEIGLIGGLVNGQGTGSGMNSSSLTTSKKNNTITVSSTDSNLTREEVKKMLESYWNQTQLTPPQGSEPQKPSQDEWTQIPSQDEGAQTPPQEDTPAQGDQDNVASKEETPRFLIDVSQEKDVTEMVIGEETIDALKTFDLVGLTTSFSSGTVSLDSTAVQQIGGGDVSVSVTEVPQENLSPQQKKAIAQAQCNAAMVVDISVLADGQEQTNFGDGTLTISVPMPLPVAGVHEILSVWYVRDDGTIERMEGEYDMRTSSYVFYTNHLSRYIVVYPETTLAFTDVPMESYCYPAVLWAVENNITTGTTETTFSPDALCTRAQIVTFLWRSAGEPQPTLSENPFSDVTSGAYYENAVLWAVENGITTGTTETTFSPEAPCTREQTATMLYRFAQVQGEDVSVGEDTNILSFADAEHISEYAIPALQWAVGTDILQGDGENLLPKDPCTRAQIVTMLWRESMI